MAQSLGVAWTWSLGGLERAGLSPGLLREAAVALPAWLNALRSAPGVHQLALDPAWWDAATRLAKGGADGDPWVALLERPPGSWGPAEAAFALSSAPKPEAQPWPGAAALLLHRRHQREGRSLAAAMQAFAPEELANLVVWACLDALGSELWAEIPEVGRVLARAEGPDAGDRAALALALRARVGLKLQGVKAAVGEGLLRPTMVPVAPAPLPLLADLALGRPSGEAPLPQLHAPPEALLAAWRLGSAAIAEAFGCALEGAVPPGLATSLPVADAAAAAGAQWLLLDESALAQAGADLGRSPEGVAWDARLLYGGMALDTPTGPLRLAFRDAVLSDRLAFQHGRMGAEEAADDLVWQLHSARRLLPDGEGHVVPLVLDALAFGRGRPDHGAGHLKAYLGRLAEEHALPAQVLGEGFPRRRWAHLSPSAHSPLARHARGTKARRLWALVKGLKPSPFDEGAPASALAATLTSLSLAASLPGEGHEATLLEGAAWAHLTRAAQALGAPLPAPAPGLPLPPPSPSLHPLAAAPPAGAPRWRLATAPLPTLAEAHADAEGLSTGEGKAAKPETNGSAKAGPAQAAKPSPAPPAGPTLAPASLMASPLPTAPKGQASPQLIRPSFAVEQASPKATGEALHSVDSPLLPAGPGLKAVAMWVVGESLQVLAQLSGTQAPQGAWVAACYPGMPAATSPWPLSALDGPATASYRFTHAWHLAASGECSLHRSDGQGGWQSLGPSGQVAWAEGALSALLPVGELPLPEGAPMKLVLALVAEAEGDEPSRIVAVAPPGEPLALKCPASVPLHSLN